MNGQSLAGRLQARIVVPDLASRPFVGDGCCSFSAAELIGESVAELRGVRGVTCDDTLGEVRVEYDAGSDALKDAMAVLDGLGYPATAVER